MLDPWLARRRATIQVTVVLKPERSSFRSGWHRSDRSARRLHWWKTRDKRFRAGTTVHRVRVKLRRYDVCGVVGEGIISSLRNYYTRVVTSSISKRLGRRWIVCATRKCSLNVTLQVHTSVLFLKRYRYVAMSYNKNFQYNIIFSLRYIFFQLSVRLLFNAKWKITGNDYKRH